MSGGWLNVIDKCFSCLQCPPMQHPCLKAHKPKFRYSHKPISIYHTTVSTPSSSPSPSHSRFHVSVPLDGYSLWQNVAVEEFENVPCYFFIAAAASAASFSILV